MPNLKTLGRNVRPGQALVTVVMREADAGQLFPADPKSRHKADFKALLTDGQNMFLATLAPGGQSSLTVAEALRRHEMRS